MGIKIKKGDFIVEDPDLVDNKKGEKDADKSKSDGDSPTEIDNPEDDVQTPELEPDGKSGAKYRRTLDKKLDRSTKEYKSRTALGKGGDKTKVSAMWDRARRAALASSGGGLSDKAKQLLIKITQNKPKVNWKKELKKFLDFAFNSYEYKLPNRRFIGRGEILYGRKRAGEGTLKTLVLPVDTSGSISRAQIKVFFEEVWRLSTNFEIDETIIIYCSDDIDNVDIVKKGKKPDLSKWASTGGNMKGFGPPFEWIQKHKIVPSAVIYLTDSYASYPATSLYGIKKYEKKVFWFLNNSSTNFEIPPFGKYIHVPMDDQGKFL